MDGLFCFFDGHEGTGVWLVALATFLAVAAALGIQAWQIWLERRREDRRRAIVNVAVFDAIASARDLCEEARSAIQMVTKVDVDEVWRCIGMVDTARRVLRHYLAAQVPLAELVPLATSTEQRLFEVGAGLHFLVDEKSLQGQAEIVRARNTLQSAVNRVRGDQVAFGNAQINVDRQRRLAK